MESEPGVAITQGNMASCCPDPFTLQDCCGTPSYMAPELILSGEECVYDDFGMAMRVVRMCAHDCNNV
eukprot:6199585-Amphidinium_carterae.1